MTSPTRRPCRTVVRPAVNCSTYVIPQGLTPYRHTPAGRPRPAHCMSEDVGSRVNRAQQRCSIRLLIGRQQRLSERGPRRRACTNGLFPGDSENRVGVVMDQHRRHPTSGLGRARRQIAADRGLTDRCIAEPIPSLPAWPDLGDPRPGRGGAGTGGWQCGRRTHWPAGLGYPTLLGGLRQSSKRAGPLPRRCLRRC